MSIIYLRPITFTVLCFLLILFCCATGAVASPSETPISIAESQQDSTYSGDGNGSIAESFRIQENYKENLTPGQKKMTTDLVQFLYPEKIKNGMSHADLVHVMKESKQIRPKGKSAENGASGEVFSDQIYVYISVYPSFSTTLLDPHVDTVVSRDEDNHIIAAWVDESKFEQISNLPHVRSIRTVTPPVTNTGSVTSEGDIILKSNQVRALPGGSNGAGIKVGLISDGANNRQSSINSGDLPASIQVLSDLQGGDEGTAMAEIVYDIAPGASIVFADDGSNSIEFARHIQDLANSGCKVICDDIIYFDEPYFEDGTVSQKINAVTAANNIIYVSCAGNYQDKHYQGIFYPQGSSPFFHDFSHVGSASPNPSPDWPNLYLDVGGGSITTIILQWDDQYGHSGNDFDLYLAAMDGTIIDYSVNSQTGHGDPFEKISYYSSNVPFDAQIGVYNYKGLAEAKMLEIYIYSDEYVYPINIVPSDSIAAHNGASSVVSVGAISALDPGSNTIEPFSSFGPVTMRYPSSVVLNKPDITGIDGNLITGTGGFGEIDLQGKHRFYGTSSAAPHVAALAALLWSKDPTKTASQIKSALMGTAVDLGSPGWDPAFGFGRADAMAAYNSLYASISPPASITNLHNTTYQQTSITWAWTEPGSADFDKVMVYFDGVFIVNVTKGTQSFFVTSLTPETQHTLATHTVSTSGMVNMTWVNSTARTAPASPVPPASITNLHNTTYQQSSITWTWIDPASADFDHVMVYLDGIFQINASKGTRSLTVGLLNPDTQHTLATHTVGTTGLVNLTWVNSTARTAPSTPVPPASIANLHNTTYQQGSITWTWTDPGSADFEKVMVYLDGLFQANITKGTQSYTASSLIPDTQHTMATHTVGASGLVNLTWINCTARTAPLSPLPPASVTNLRNTTYQQTTISWVWTDPSSTDLDHVMVFLDGMFQANITKGVQTYTASALTPSTEYTIGTRTVGTTGLVGTTWVNNTARTRNSILLMPFPGQQSSPTDIDEDDLYEDINGNGRKDFNDVVILFKYLEWVKDNEPVGCFDLNGNGRIDYNDVVLLFKKV